MRVATQALTRRHASAAALQATSTLGYFSSSGLYGRPLQCHAERLSLYCTVEERKH